MIRITTLFLDIGGVLLTNGWDHRARESAAAHFNLDLKELESRHNLTFDTYEVGKLTLEEYLYRVVFYEKRPFSKQEFEAFMLAASTPYNDMLELIATLKARHALKVAVVSNEGRELNEYRIKKFKLTSFVDFFISSCFVHVRKPDVDIYKIALDIAQVEPRDVLYIEDRPMFCQIAESLGINSLCHRDFLSTKEALHAYGLI
jgi:putative hydrolase of the HAD superfamily